MNNDLLRVARQLVQNNQNKIPNAPWAQAAVQAIMNGDQQAGMQIADNLCSSFGETRTSGVQKAIQFFSGR